MNPPAGAEELTKTYIGKGAVRQLSIPLVRNVSDLTGGLVPGDVDHAVDNLLLVDALDHVAGAQIHDNRVAGRLDLMAEAFDLGEGSR